MIDIDGRMKPSTTTSPPGTVKEAVTNDLPAAPWHLWPGCVWRSVKRYPIPLGALALLAVSLVFWLTGRGDVASWTLLAVVLVGGIPLLWETLQQFLHKEFSVDVIALLAITGS